MRGFLEPDFFTDLLANGAGATFFAGCVIE